MKNLTLQPTEENIISTFCQNRIGRNEDLLRFITFLCSIEGGASVALDSYWGAGKTFFVKQTKMIFEMNNPILNSNNCDDVVTNQWKELFSNVSCKNESEHVENIIHSILPVYYDAWGNDNDVDPVLSIIYQIVRALDVKFYNEENELFFKTSKLIGGIAGALSGRDINAALDAFHDMKPKEVYEIIASQKDLECQVIEFLDSIMCERANKMIIFVDELDRCRPDYAVRFLERIKHYFTNDRIVFVFSVNLLELGHTVKHFYGNDFDATRYLDRFFDWKISLPPVDHNRYFESLNVTRSTTIKTIAKEIISTYNFTLREISRYSQFLNIVDNWRSQNPMVLFHQESSNYIYCIIIPIMLGLKIADEKKYSRFVSGGGYLDLEKIVLNKPYSNQLMNPLLNQGEQYGEIDHTLFYTKKQEREKTNLDPADKLELLYNAIFGNVINKDKTTIRLGEISIDEDMKDFVLHVVSLLPENL